MMRTIKFRGLRKDGKEIYEGDFIEAKNKLGFHSELLNEFKRLNNLESINGINSHFQGVVSLDSFRGLMFENPENGYREPMFSRNMEVKPYLGEIKVIGNIHEKQSGQ